MSSSRNSFASAVACLRYAGSVSGVSIPLPRGMPILRQLLPSGSHASSSGCIVVLLIGTMSPMDRGWACIKSPVA
jgi:hypothetical protein